MENYFLKNENFRIILFFSGEIKNFKSSLKAFLSKLFHSQQKFIFKGFFLQK